MKLHEAIAKARETKGFSLRDLERRTGLSNQLLSGIETGRVVEPGWWKVVAIAKALGLSLKQLSATE